MFKKMNGSIVQLFTLMFSLLFIVNSYALDMPKNINETLISSLNEEFTLKKNQSVIIQNEDLRIKIINFYNSPCPSDVQCFWSGVGIKFEYRKNGEIQEGINRAHAFGYKTIIIESDYEAYAKLKVEKI